MVLKKGKSQITFIFHPDSTACRQVAVAGSFNDWHPEDGKMARQKDGTFRKRLQLEPGEYRYRFVVDGRWVEDGEAERQVPNPYGGMDSLVKVG